MSNVHVIGEGIFGWSRGERVGDRYGAVGLWECIKKTDDAWGAEFGDEVKLDVTGILTLRGKLRVVILETRESHHIGDMFHGLGPSTPKVGETIELGIGTLFIEFDDCEGGGRVGVRPDEKRPHFWMNPQNLYRAHDQTVRLEFVEDDLDMESWIKGEED